jgi:hypothetical protein
MPAERQNRAQTVVALRRKDPGEEDAEIIAVLGLSFELAVSPEAVEAIIDSALPGDPAERVAAVLDEIDVDWVDHLDWPLAKDAGQGAGVLPLAFRSALADAVANRARARAGRNGPVADPTRAKPDSAGSAS